MIEPASKRPAPISSNLALRVAVVGFVGFALFGVLFLRLWFLQVLSGDQYVAQATQNRVRIEPIQAPRGDIVDRDDNVLVENRQATVLRLKPSTLPDDVRQDAVNWGNAVEARRKRPAGQKGPAVPYPAVRPEVAKRFRSLSKLTGVSVADIQERVMVGLYQVPYAQIRIKTDVRDDVRTFVQERPDEFPGVTVDQVYVREYPHGSLAAQLMGTVSEISPKQLDTKKFKGVRQGTIVGQTGLEYEYDRYLRGTDGRLITNVDAQGLARDNATRTEPSTPGQQVKLSLDLGLQETGQKWLAKYGGGKPGAFVAMDPDTGEVYAMGSAPSFDPNRLSRPITDREYKRLFGDAAGAPQVNRATQSAYPVGSTFKPITSFAALATGVISPSSVIGDSSGCITIGIAQQRCNAGKVALGSQNVVGALKVSSDVFFYRLGQYIFQRKGQALQQWARRLGLGRHTGIDLPDENTGNVPDAAWRDRLNAEERKCRPTNGGRPCYALDIRPYNLGDNVSLAVGQGDFLATPLQMATAYSAIANGGRVVKPHLGSSVEDNQGRLVQRLSHGTARKVSLPGADLDAIRAGLHEAASSPGGTSASVFTGWPQSQLPIYGKTGTAQTGNLEAAGDQSWYVAYVPRTAGNTRPLVVAATIEKGGFGAAAAAPTVCRILAKWYHRTNVPCAPGSNSDQ